MDWSEVALFIQKEIQKRLAIKLQIDSFDYKSKRTITEVF